MSTSPECGRSFVRVPSAKSAKSPDTVLLISAPESSLRQTASSPPTQLNAGTQMSSRTGEDHSPCITSSNDKLDHRVDCAIHSACGC